jgi:beta-galactosidase
VFTNCDSVKLYKNGEYIGAYLPDRGHFPNLPHPPVIITDFIGSLMERSEGFSRREAERIKRIFFAIMRYGEKSLPIWYKLSMGAAMLKHRLSYKDASDLFMRYVAGWGSASIEYVFEGYIGGKLAVTATKGPAGSGGLRIRSDSETLTEDETYDVCRVAIEHVDTLGNVMRYSNEVVQVEIEGAGEIIGPKSLALTGGSAAFWVKSTGEGGIGITIVSPRFGAQELRLQVQKSERVQG